MPPPAPHLRGQLAAASLAPALPPSPLELPAPILGLRSTIFLGSGLAFIGGAGVAGYMLCRGGCDAVGSATVGTLASVGTGLVVLSAVFLGVDAQRKRARAESRGLIVRFRVGADGLHF